MQLLQGGLGLPTREYFLEPRDDPKIKAYEKYAVEIATLFGAYKPHAAQEIRDMIDFEMEYAKVTVLNKYYADLLSSMLCWLY